MNVTHLVHSLLPAVFSLHHELDAVGQRGEDPGCGGFERDGLAFEVDAVDSLRIQGLEHCMGGGGGHMSLGDPSGMVLKKFLE